jgi:hypothetical protein
MKKWTAFYVEFLFAGSFVDEKSIQPIESCELSDLTLPKYAFGFQFYKRTEAEVDGEKLIGQMRDASKLHYIGEVFTAVDIEKLPDPNGNRFDILLSNMRANGWPKVVRTSAGNFKPLEKDVVVLAEGAVKRSRK